MIKTFQVKYLPHLKNKFFLTFLGFLLWLSFFDRNDFLTTSSYHQKLKELRHDRDYFESEVLKNQAYLDELRSNPNNLEKYGRERYFMKRDNEDVFVIVTPHKKETNNSRTD